MTECNFLQSKNNSQSECIICYNNKKLYNCRTCKSGIICINCIYQTRTETGCCLIHFNCSLCRSQNELPIERLNKPQILELYKNSLHNDKYDENGERLYAIHQLVHLFIIFNPPVLTNTNIEYSGKTIVFNRYIVDNHNTEYHELNEPLEETEHEFIQQLYNLYKTEDLPQIPNKYYGIMFSTDQQNYEIIDAELFNKLI